MRTLENVLQSTSEFLFPAEAGKKVISINSIGPDGDTPLHVLLWQRDIEGAALLIAAGANVNATGDMGATPLHVAVSQVLPEAIHVLLAAGANPDIRSELGTTARELAMAKGGAVALAINGTAPNDSFKADK